MSNFPSNLLLLAFFKSHVFLFSTFLPVEYLLLVIININCPILLIIESCLPLFRSHFFTNVLETQSLQSSFVFLSSLSNVLVYFKWQISKISSKTFNLDVSLGLIFYWTTKWSTFPAPKWSRFSLVCIFRGRFFSVFFMISWFPFLVSMYRMMDHFGLNKNW